MYKKENTLLRTSFVLFLTLFFGFLLLFPLFVYAQDTFVPLTEGGIPGVKTGTSFSGFLNAAFKLGLAAAATLAVVMITIGGLQYMTTDSIYNKTEGKEKIQDAIIGLLIALLIWLILFTINPNLLKFDINIDGTKTDQGVFKKQNNKKNKAGNALKTGPFDTKTEKGKDPKDIVDPGAVLGG